MQPCSNINNLIKINANRIYHIACSHTNAPIYKLTHTLANGRFGALISANWIHWRTIYRGLFLKLIRHGFIKNINTILILRSCPSVPNPLRISLYPWLMSYKLIEFESLESEKYLYLYLSVYFGCARRLEPVDLWACEIRVRINATRVLLVYAPPTTNGLD